MGGWISSMFGSSGEEKKEGASKSINLVDPYAVKRHLDDMASEIILAQGYQEDVSLSNLKMLLGVLACGIALLAQFYPKKFPDNQPLLVLCVILYVAVNAALQFIGIYKEKNHILFTHPLAGTLTRTGLAVASSLERFSDMYTLQVSSADPTSIAAHEPVELTKRVTQWFMEDGQLAEDIFSEDVVKLVARFEDDSNESRKKK